MKYTIEKIFPGQIKVRFEDGSWAKVPIQPDATAEEIDNAVSKYDSDFLPDPETITNKNITIGEERVSSKLTLNNPYEEVKVSTGSTTVIMMDGSNRVEIQSTPYIPDPSISQGFTPTIVPNKVDFGLAHAVDVLAVVEYYASKGDTRLKDILMSKVEKFIADPIFSFDEFLENLEFDADHVFDLAEAELNEEG